jgi:subtilisin family serine protease
MSPAAHRPNFRFCLALAVAAWSLTGLSTVHAASAGKTPALASASRQLTPIGPNSGGAGGSGGDAQLPGEILVKLRSTAALPELLRRYPLTLMDRFGARPIYRLKLTSNNPRVFAEVLGALSTFEPDVLLAEANTTHSSPEARGNMPWVIGNPGDYVAQWAPQAMRLAGAQALATGAGVRVAVLDTGFDLTHPLLAGRWLPGFDFVDFDTNPGEVATPAQTGYGHGTHVAGLVAMVAPGARIMPLRILDNAGVGNAWVLGEALLYALDPDGNPATDDGAHIINLSLGSLTRTRLIAALAHLAACGDSVDGDPIADHSDPGYNDDAIRCARRKGVLVIAAAGNDGSGSVKQYPAAEGAYGLVPIGASTRFNRMASFSNSGSWVNLAAPGEGITSASPGGGYATWNGTSMAAPLAAGTAALVQSLDFSLTAKDLARRLERSSAGLCGTNTRRVDALAAVTDTVAPAPSCP